MVGTLGVVSSILQVQQCVDPQAEAIYLEPNKTHEVLCNSTDGPAFSFGIPS